MLEVNEVSELLPDIYEFIRLKGIELDENDGAVDSNAAATTPKCLKLILGCKITEKSEDEKTFKCPNIGKWVPDCLICNVKRKKEPCLAIACNTDTALFDRIKNSIVKDLKSAEGKLSFETIASTFLQKFHNNIPSFFRLKKKTILLYSKSQRL